MTKHLLLTIIVTLICVNGYSQITITANDMPVAGDTFIYSSVSAAGATISPGDSGANMTWSYALTPTTHGMNIYKTTAEVNPFLELTIPSNLYGYITADSIPDVELLVPGVTIQNIYTFFEKIDVPSSFVAAAFAASFTGIPLGTNYRNPDVWYIFPLTYGSSDSNNYELNISLSTFGSLNETGYRKTRVDGWGTITTPYYTTPVNCIRVRSEIHETDSIPVGGMKIGIPRNSVEYKWLDNIDHHPALWVTSNVIGGTEIITNIQYRDKLLPTLIHGPNAQKNTANVTAYPNPAPNGVVTLNMPQDWQTYHIDVFDMQAKTVTMQDNVPVLNLQSLPAGNYVVRVLCGTSVAYVPIVK